MSRMQTNPGRGNRRRLGVTLAMSVGVLAGCEGLLDVELPGQIAETTLFEPGQAGILVNSAIANIECSYSDFVASNAAGYEDVYLRVTGWWPGSLEYPVAPGTANCNTGTTSYGWWTPLHYGRFLAEETYERIAEWGTDQVGPNAERLQAQSAIYAGIAYNLLGEHFCEVAVDAGELMTPDQTLAEAEDWLDTALQHISSTGDFAIGNGVTSSAQEMAYLLRSRVRYARGDFSGAAADAQQISQGFKAFATRDAGGERTRWNRVVEAHNNEGWGTIMGQVSWWEGPGDWGDVIPFTGYHNLGILPNGRAVTEAGLSISFDAFPDAVEDTRVPVDSIGTFNNFPRWVQRKYNDLSAPIPMANWEEAWLIRAEIAGGQTAIDLVNDIRAAHDLPLVTYLSPDDSEGIRNLIIEERRRSLFLEGRFWSTKLQQDLWFPRGYDTTPDPYNYQDGVRMVMPLSEFELNPNLQPSERGTLCAADEQPTI